MAAAAAGRVRRREMGTLTGPSLAAAAAAAAVVMGRAVTQMLLMQTWKLAQQVTVEVSMGGGGLNSNVGQSWVWGWGWHAVCAQKRGAADATRPL